MPKRVIRQSLIVSLLLLGSKTVLFASMAEVYPLPRIASKYGEAAQKRFKSLQKIINESSGLSESERLVCVNNFFNQVPYQSDRVCWGISDYWATPIEMLGVGKADCEDYAIAKFFTLIEMGIPQEKLFLTYAVTDDARNKHVVLAYYADERAVPLILDNRELNIVPEKVNKDYIPLYRFNLAQYMAYDQGFARKSPIDMKKLEKWETLTKRL
jgi:predicted transglutaminase-like cysteine proteinase